MKRKGAVLVDYSSSEDDGISPKPPSLKKRKLPQIFPSVLLPVHVDNVDAHQGRLRTTPHIDGQFSAHVYVSLDLSCNPLLNGLLHAILCDAKKDIPALREIWDGNCELHISLSRPIFLRAHQREDLKRAVKRVAKSNKAFVASFALLSELINDEKTRTFLTAEVGAGHRELRSMADALTPALEAILQPEYYTNPIFHASIAWALLHRPVNSNFGLVDSDFDSTSSSEQVADDSSQGSHVSALSAFPTLPCLPPDVVISLNERYRSDLSSPKVGAFDVESLTLKIGKEVYSWRLETG